MLVKLNKCIVCGSDWQRGHSGGGCLTSSILFKYERSSGHLFVLSSARVRRLLGGRWFGVMYCEWYGVCDLLCCVVGC